MAFDFNPDIPQPGDNPSNSQPILLTNNTSINGLINVDHENFGTTYAGLHSKVSFVGYSSVVLPAGCTAGLYATTQNIFYKNSAGNIAQLTCRVNPSAAQSGYTFMAGGILMQWGKNTVTINAGTGEGGAISFPRAFTGTPYNISVTEVTSNTAVRNFVRVSSTTAPTSSQFVINAINTISSNPGSVVVYWTAIGLF